MERLTFRHDCPGLDFHGGAEPCEPINCCDGYSKKALDTVVDRLAAYEDICFDADGKERVTVDELSALVKARDEGRLVVLDTPRNPLVWGDDDHETCLCPDCGADLMGLHYGERMILQCPVCGQYLDTTKIIARAEAERALGGGGDG